mgnify:CR=1 FL=1
MPLLSVEGVTRRFGGDYRVEPHLAAHSALDAVSRLKAEGEEIALVIADQWMPGMTGVEFLTNTRPLYPGAKRALLFERGNRTTREPILQAMALGQIDYYVPKPERPPDEEFHRCIAQFLEEWAVNPETLQGLARHYETGEPIPTEMISRLRAAREFGEYGKGLQARHQMFYAGLSLNFYNRNPATKMPILSQVMFSSVE